MQQSEPGRRGAESEQAKANEMVLEMDHPTSGNIRVPGIPYQLKHRRASVRSLQGGAGSFKRLRESLTRILKNWGVRCRLGG